MRFMMIVKASKDSEAGAIPEEQLIMQMMKYNEELVKAGVLLAGEGLHPSSNGVRIIHPGGGGKPKVVDGPFAETKELIAGFWLIQVKSKAEALEWALRAPDPHGHGEGQIELRQVIETEELTDNPEILEQEAGLRRQIEQRQ